MCKWDKKTYFNKMRLPDDTESKSRKDNEKMDTEKQKRALERAHDIRKFEIGLYWERSKYMYVMVGAVFVGWYTDVGNHPPHHDVMVGAVFVGWYTIHPKSPHIELFLLLVGMVFSLGWVLINRGSRFWQENWEAHIDYLEDDIEGKLYKTVNETDLYKDGFSVSKVNLYLSIFVFLAFSAMFMWNMLHTDTIKRIWETLINLNTEHIPYIVMGGFGAWIFVMGGILALGLCFCKKLCEKLCKILSLGFLRSRPQAEISIDKKFRQRKFKNNT